MIPVVGGGILGRLTALTLLRRGHAVRLHAGGASASGVAAGMLAPWCERDSAPPQIAEMGVAALARWPEILRSLAAPVFFQRAGSFVVGDPDELSRLARRAGGETRATKEVEREIDGRFPRGLYFEDEGQLDAQAALRAVRETFLAEGGEVAERFDGTGPHIDCRGLAARDVLPLRGVRGEILEVAAPDVRISRPVRLAHPRYPLYVVPRPGGRYLIGATQIESDDAGPVTVRSALELLSAAFALHSGFGEARIVEMRAGVRPAFADNLPRIEKRGDVIYANGLFRHGFLLAPILAEKIAETV